MTFEYEKAWTAVVFKGVRYRSVLEAQWAFVFDHFDIRAKYEPKQYETDRGPYTPDFLLEELGFIEVKPLKEAGANPCDDDYMSVELKLSALARSHPARHYILLCGTPLHHTSWCLDAQDYSHSWHGNMFFTHDRMAWWGREAPRKATWIGSAPRGGTWSDIAQRAVDHQYEPHSAPRANPKAA